MRWGDLDDAERDRLRAFSLNYWAINLGFANNAPNAGGSSTRVPINGSTIVSNFAGFSVVAVSLIASGLPTLGRADHDRHMRETRALMEGRERITLGTAVTISGLYPVAGGGAALAGPRPAEAPAGAATEASAGPKRQVTMPISWNACVKTATV